VAAGAYPHSLDIEQAVLGAGMLRDVHLDRMLERLDAEDFYSGAHQTIFSGLRELRNSATGARDVELVTLLDHLERRGLLGQVGGFEALSRCQEVAASAVQLEEHLSILQEYSTLRGLIDLSVELGQRAKDGAEAANTLLDAAQERLLKLGEGGRTERMRDFQDVLRTTYEHIKELSERGGETTGVPTGFPDLDRLTAGFHPGQLVILAARPSMGKTALALNLSLNAARAGHTVAFFSMEMSPEALASRLITAYGFFDADRIRRGRIQSDEWDRLFDTFTQLESLPICIDDTPAVSLAQLRVRCRRLQVQRSLSMVIVDYLQLMKPPERIDSREQQIAAMSRGLKQLSRDLGVPVVALSQLNRALESRSGAKRRPMLSDLRESGAIEQDADLVMFIHREAVYDDSADETAAELIIGKQRNGPTGVVNLSWQGHNASFYSLERTDDGF
jgi:replicative DNA helicase